MKYECILSFTPILLWMIYLTSSEKQQKIKEVTLASAYANITMKWHLLSNGKALADRKNFFKVVSDRKISNLAWNSEQ